MPSMSRDCAGALTRNWLKNWAAGRRCPPLTRAAANSLQDLEAVTRLGQGRIDLTIGSALDIFGGTGVRYADVVAFNRKQTKAA